MDEMGVAPKFDARAIPVLAPREEVLRPADRSRIVQMDSFGNGDNLLVARQAVTTIVRHAPKNCQTAVRFCDVFAMAG